MSRKEESMAGQAMKYRDAQSIARAEVYGNEAAGFARAGDAESAYWAARNAVKAALYVGRQAGLDACLSYGYGVVSKARVEEIMAERQS